MRNKKSFTLIEMLIVIVIIGILAAALVPRLVSVQGRARDTRRAADMNQIYNALNIYRADKWYVKMSENYYWGNDPWGWDFSSLSGNTSTPSFISFLATEGVMTAVPLDPLNNMTTSMVAWTYAYRYYCYPAASAPNDGISMWYNKEQSWGNQVRAHQWSSHTERWWECQ